MPMNNRLLRPRASGFNPRSVSGLTLWLDAADSATMGPTSSGPGAVTNNGPVKYWGDKSGAGKNVINSGADSVCPSFLSNYYLGRSGLSFDGGDFLQSTSAGLQIAPATIFAAIEETTRVAYAGVVIAAPSTGDDFSQNGAAILTVHDNPVGTEPVTYVSRSPSPGSAASTELRAGQGSYLTALGKRILCASATSSTALMRVDGLQGTTDTAHEASGTSAGIVIGGRYLGGAVNAGFRFNGRILEVLHYNAALSSANIALVERYLANKWGMTLA